MKEMGRNLFGTNNSIESEMANAETICTTLRSPTRKISSKIRWKIGYSPVKEDSIPTLMVSSTFGDNTVYLYALNFNTTSANSIKKSAILAANAYFADGELKSFFKTLKMFSNWESSRSNISTPKEFTCILYLSIHLLRQHFSNYDKDSQRLFKALKDNLNKVITTFRPLVANIRTLLRLEKLRFISGRPKKKKPPDFTDYLPGFFYSFLSKQSLSLSRFKKSGIRVIVYFNMKVKRENILVWKMHTHADNTSP